MANGFYERIERLNLPEVLRTLELLDGKPVETFHKVISITSRTVARACRGHSR